MQPIQRILLGLAAAGATLLVTSSAAAEGPGDVEGTECVPAGEVISLAGRLQARAPGAPPRWLECGALVCANDDLSTDAASRAGVLVGETLVQLERESAARIGLTPEAAVDVAVARGSVRVVDPGGGGPQARITAAGAEGRLVGNDTEVHVLREKTGAYALLCEWDAPLAVTRGDQARTASPGECIVAKRSEPLYQAPGHAERLAVLEATCNPRLPLAPLAHLEPLPIVSSPPPDDSPPLPDGTPFPPPSPCDDPGLNCAGGPVVVEPPPTEDPFPGGGGVFNPNP